MLFKILCVAETTIKMSLNIYVLLTILFLLISSAKTCAQLGVPSYSLNI